MIELWEGCYLCHLVVMSHGAPAVLLLSCQSKRELFSEGDLAGAQGCALAGLLTEQAPGLVRDLPFHKHSPHSWLHNCILPEIQSLGVPIVALWY